MLYYKVVEDKEGLWLTEETYQRAYIMKTESVFSQCNGHFGVRAALEFDGISQSRGMFVNGLYQQAHEDEVTELVNCPDLVQLQLLVNGECLSLDMVRIIDYCRKWNVYTGELVTEVTCCTQNGIKLKVESARFASRKDTHLFCHEVKLQLLEAKEAELSITYGINGQITNSGVSHFKKTECRVLVSSPKDQAKDGVDKSYMTYRGELSDDGLELMMGSSLTGGKEDSKEVFQLKRRSIFKNRRVTLKNEEKLRLLRVSYIREWSQTDRDCQENPVAILKNELEKGYEILRSEHSQKMDEFWEKARIQIEGATLLEKASICFSQYHLYGMVAEGRSTCSVGAKGLTGEGYKGHVFWDTEIFVLPFFYYVFPDTAKNLLKYRYHGIEGAQAKAEEYRFRGLMYPWEAAKSGYEETPLYAALNIHTGKANKVWSGIKEHHVTADIVYAIMKYGAITEDWEFIENCGADIVFGAANFWVSRAVKRGSRLEILDIIGPDEYNEHIDNNTYTNYMAAFAVRAAIYLKEQLGQHRPSYFSSNRCPSAWETRVEGWKYFTDHIYLAKPKAEGIIPQDDTFLQKKELPDIERYKSSQVKQSVLLDYSRDEVVDMQVLKQADLVMLMNLLPELFEPEIVEKNVLFYEKRTLHDSSLSYCAHAQACACIGADEMAWEFFEKAMEVDLVDNPYDSTDGIHAASLGGIWNCVIQGFAGISHDWGKLSIHPHLPKHWNAIAFQLRIQNTAVQVYITRKIVSLKLEKPLNNPITVIIGGKCDKLTKDLEMSY